MSAPATVAPTSSRSKRKPSRKWVYVLESFRTTLKDKGFKLIVPKGSSSATLLNKERIFWEELVARIVCPSRSDN